MSEIIGYLLTLNAVFTWAIASLVYKWGLKKAQPKASLFFRLCCVCVGTFIFSLIFGNYIFLTSLSGQDLLAYMIACVISGLTVTVGDLFYYFSLSRIDASRAYPLTQLSLVFVYPFAFFFFGEPIKLSVLLGGLLIISSVFILSTKDKLEKEEKVLDEKSTSNNTPNTLIIGILLAIGTALLWAVSIVSFNQARIISGEVFSTNFFRVFYSTIAFTILGFFQRDYFSGFKKEQRKYLKYYIYIGIAGILSLGLADTLFYKAAEINGLILTSTITVNTPMVQQILSILILKEKFRKRFIVAVVMIIAGNYIILFL